MKKLLFSQLLVFVISSSLVAQQIDTLAIQDFEVTPATPTWTFTGPVVYNSGFTSATAAPPNSPIGINGSRAWETTTNSGGLILQFANIPIPAGYDSIRFRFNLSAMNLNSSTGGPDDLDYVLVEVSVNGASTFYNRLRIRGATANNSFWPYSATGVAKVYYMPTGEVVFQPTTSGLQSTFGYSNCEIVFPGTVPSVAIRIVGRSSSSSDTWLIDNVVLTGDKSCTNTMSSITETVCDSFVAPSGAVFKASGIYTDTIPNAAFCDSIITVNLTVDSIDLNITSSNDTAQVSQTSGTYQWYNCVSGIPVPGANGQQFIASADGLYGCIIQNGSCLDSTDCVELTIPLPSGIQSYSAVEIKMAPNPVQEVLYLEAGQQLDQAELVIRDISGKEIKKVEVRGFRRHSLEVDDLQPGLYFLECRMIDHRVLLRFIKE